MLFSGRGTTARPPGSSPQGVACRWHAMLAISLGKDAGSGQAGHARIAIAETTRNSFSVAPLAA
jgi:hypothetical protein